MKYYAPENAFFMLPFQFDVTLLQKDLLLCNEFEFLKNYVPANYDGKNYILPLRSIHGDLNFAAATPNNKDKYKDTIVLEKCTYFKQVIDQFICEKEAIRLMNLPPGGVVNVHTDHNCGYEDGVFRIHIPIVSNDHVHFNLNNNTIVMKPGEVWYTNVNLPHGVTNNGPKHRVHLVMDCVRNAWSDDLFGNMGYDFSQEKEVEETHPISTIHRMIEELEKQDSIGAKTLIAQIKAQNGL